MSTTRIVTGVNAGDPTRATLRDLFNMQAPAWFDEAVCAQTDPEAFYPLQGGNPAAARATCGACPVREKCLDYAMETEEPHGIWGGLTARERYRLRRAARAAS